MWVGVRQRFQSFHPDLNLTQDQINDGLGKSKSVCQSLERAYYERSSDNPPGLLVGSWGKWTQVRPPRDVDVFFVLPWDVYYRFEQREGNRQSHLLQEVRSVLQGTYPQTDMRGDGQVVTVRFNTVMVEVVPVFVHQSGQFTMPNTNDGGRWKIADPLAQFGQINWIDQATNGNARTLSKMMKLWKREQNVPLKSFLLELVMTEFLPVCQWGAYNHFYYDWLVRDFLRYLLARVNSHVIIPGTNEVVWLGDAWKS